MNHTLAEQLFIKYFLSTFKLGEVIYTKPTSFDNLISNMDTIKPLSEESRDIVLMYKPCEYDEVKDEFTFKISRNEQELYTNLYPNKSVFYISCVHKTIEALIDAQLHAKSSDTFLRAYVAVNAKAIEYGVNKVHYEAFKFETSKPKPFYTKQYDQKKLHPDDYTKANLLSKLLKSNTVGTVLESVEDRKDQQPDIVQRIQDMDQESLFEGWNNVTIIK